MESIIFKSATNIILQISTQNITSEEVCIQFLDHIEKYNTKINAITDLRSRESIIAEAKEKDKAIKENKPLGLLHGLPMTVKDSYNVKGLISSNGSPQLKSNVATYDADLITLLKNEGAIIIGKTNIAMYALDWQSTNKWFGQTSNPYNLDYVVGGSSGGSAASLASGFSPLELGTDAGGSIRVPAHFCGVYGLRTTESLLPMRGNMATPKSLRTGRYLISNGPMARNMDDLILMMNVLSNTNQRYSENPPVDIKQYRLTPNKQIKIAYSETIDDIELDAEYKEIYENFIEKIKQTNLFVIENTKPNYDSDRLITLWGKIAGFDMGVALKIIPFKSIIASLFIRNMHKDKQWGKAMGSGAGINPRGYAIALEEKDNISDEFTRFFKDFDIWITPVSADKAFKHQKPGKPFNINGKKVPYTKAFVPFNFPSTIPGHPILVIPIGLTKSGLPVGIQIHSQKWHDYKLLEIGKKLEKMTNGFQIPKLNLIINNSEKS
jgi:amidase